MIRKVPSGSYRLYSRKVDPKTGKRRNLDTFETREQAEKHEREVQYLEALRRIALACRLRGDSEFPFCPAYGQS